MANAISFLSPVGRLVAGSVFEPQTHDFQGKPKLTKDGQPRVEYFIALAIPKTDPGWPGLLSILTQAARDTFPTLFGADGSCLAPRFSWKYKDGDSTEPNQTGNRPCDREGYPGHWVLNLSSGFAPRAYVRNAAGAYDQIVDQSGIKCGDYIRVAGSAVGNGQPLTPGLYLNLMMVERVGHGEPIVTGPSAETVFGGAPATLPPAASPTPVAPTGGIAPPAGVQPVRSFLTPPPAAPTAPAAPPPPPAAPAPEPTYNVSGTAYTRAQLLAAGWTEAQIATLGA